MKKLFYLTLLSLLAFSFSLSAQEKIFFSNHSSVPKILQEFKDGCELYGIDYREKLASLVSIKVIEGERSFLGRVEGNHIQINSLLANYPNLFRVVVLRQLGKYYGLKDYGDEGSLHIMSSRWEIGLKFELYAFKHRKRGIQRDYYFESLKKEHPRDKEL